MITLHTIKLWLTFIVVTNFCLMLFVKQQNNDLIKAYASAEKKVQTQIKNLKIDYNDVLNDVKKDSEQTLIISKSIIAKKRQTQRHITNNSVFPNSSSINFFKELMKRRITKLEMDSAGTSFNYLGTPLDTIQVLAVKITNIDKLGNPSQVVLTTSGNYFQTGARVILNSIQTLHYSNGTYTQVSKEIARLKVASTNGETVNCRVYDFSPTFKDEIGNGSALNAITFRPYYLY